jgi:hypothetical protein
MRLRLFRLASIYTEGDLPTNTWGDISQQSAAWKLKSKGVAVETFIMLIDFQKDEQKAQACAIALISTATIQNFGDFSSNSKLRAMLSLGCKPNLPISLLAGLPFTVPIRGPHL